MPKIINEIPHVKQIAIKRDTVQTLICNRIGWTDQQFFDFQFDAGYAFIDAVFIPVGVDEKRILTHSAMFWGWWRNQWLRRDILLYDMPYLDAELYADQHTKVLLKCGLTIRSFWSHIETMIDDGTSRLLDDKKGQEL